MNADLFDNTTQPLCISPLSESERARLLSLLDPLVRFLGAPGDWGYGTKLGDTTIRLIALKKEISDGK